MSKARDDKKDAYKALLAYRNTIQDGLTTSPSQRFLGRRTKTDLPTTKTLLKPERNDIKEKRDRIVKQERTEKSFNKHAKDLDPLEENDSVRVRPVSLRDKIWVKAKVIQRLDERSYLLKNNKRIFRRNRVDLRKVPNKDDSETQEKDIPVTESHDNFKDNPQSDIQAEETPQKEVIEPRRKEITPERPKTVEHPVSESRQANEQTGYRTRPGRQIVRPKYLKDYV